MLLFPPRFERFPLKVFLIFHDPNPSHTLVRQHHRRRPSLFFSFCSSASFLHAWCCGCVGRGERAYAKDGGRKNEEILLFASVDLFFLRIKRRDLNQNLSGNSPFLHHHHHHHHKRERTTHHHRTKMVATKKKKQRVNYKEDSSEEEDESDSEDDVPLAALKSKKPAAKTAAVKKKATPPAKKKTTTKKTPAKKKKAPVKKKTKPTTETASKRKSTNSWAKNGTLRTRKIL